MNILFVGGGNMAQALIGGMSRKPAAPAAARDAAIQPDEVATASIRVIEPSVAQRSVLAERFKAAAAERFEPQWPAADVIVMAVKPQQMREAAGAVASRLEPDTLVLSIAAGIRIADLRRWLGGHQRIVRAMPNTPALIGAGVTGLHATEAVDARGRQRAQAIMQAVGEVVWVDRESLLDAVTAVSGSGPAYVFKFIESVEAAALAQGLNAEQARALTIGTFVGAARLAAASDEPPSTLRERVTSKGGTTAAGLEVMNTEDLAGTIARAVAAACKRSVELGDEFGRD